MNAKIVLLPGDGIGPEVVGEARRVLDAVAKLFGHQFEYAEHLLGGCAIDATGTAMPEATLQACQGAQAVLLGAVGGPKWDDPQAKVRPEQGLLAIRKGLGLYANLRPVKAIPSLAKLSPLKPERVAGVDFIVIRELTGGLYFGQPKGRSATPEGGVQAVDTLIYTDVEIRRIVRLAFTLARGRRKLVTSIDKANVLESSRLWRQIAIEVGKEFPDVKLEHQLVDSAAMRLVTHAAQFDVIVTENMFGDILTDEAAVLAGSLGLLPSASLGEGKLGLYEPIHGSAPDIAGKGIANPTGTILSAAMLLRHSLGLEAEARAIEAAVSAAIDEGCHTGDLGAAKPITTTQMGDAVRARLKR
ncbi:MAG: 3-isopropylmalate dehydrogenase [Verrucomicrobiota bacterium]|jgi:3-isopropylmalate dehydrogenase